MSLLANIDHLTVAAGIEAVVVDAESRDYRGDQSWHPVLDGALDLFHRTDEKSIRLVIGKHTVVVQKEGSETVGVVLPTGHAIAKSLRRMIRRMARKDRGPLPKEAAAAPAPAPVAAPVASVSTAPVATPAAPAPTSAPPPVVTPKSDPKSDASSEVIDDAPSGYTTF